MTASKNMGLLLLNKYSRKDCQIDSLQETPEKVCIQVGPKEETNP